MAVISGWMRAVLVAGASLSTAACISYPSEPRYPTHPMALPGQGAPTTSYPPQGQQPYGQYGYKPHKRRKSFLEELFD